MRRRAGRACIPGRAVHLLVQIHVHRHIELVSQEHTFASSTRNVTFSVSSSFLQSQLTSQEYSASVTLMPAHMQELCMLTGHDADGQRHHLPLRGPAGSLKVSAGCIACGEALCA